MFGVSTRPRVFSQPGLARRALESEKDVFVEKPMALTVGEGRALCELAERRNRILMVGHLLEYHPAVRRLVELVRTGTEEEKSVTLTLIQYKPP